MDFWCQSDESIEVKERQDFFVAGFYKTELFKHSTLYVILSCSIFLLYQSENFWNVIIAVLLLSSHIIIDLTKKNLNKVFPKFKNHLFFVDQSLHILVLTILSLFIEQNFIAKIELSFYEPYINSFLALVLLGKTGNVIFGVLFSKYKPNDVDDDKGHKNAGAIIGTLERVLMLIFLVMSEFTAIGYVIAAKSLARFSKLAKTQFGEYFIIGTLFSVLYTILVYYFLFT